MKNMHPKNSLRLTFNKRFYSRIVARNNMRLEPDYYTNLS